MSRLLGDVVRATSSASSVDAALDRATELLTSMADWVITDRLDDPDLVTRVAAYDAAGRMRLPEGLGAPAARRSAAGSVGLLPALLESPRRMILLEREALTQMSRSGDPHRARQAQMALDLGATQVLVLGLVARDSLLGVLSLGLRGRFRDEDLVELAEIAAHLGLALDASRLLGVQHTVATAMQTSLLPPLPAVAGLSLAARYAPASRGLQVGGDWYDAFATETGLVIVLGDASGHDVSAAARMADLRNLLRAHAVDRDEPPAALITRLDATAAALGLDALATCLVGRLRPLDGSWSMTWASAGHLPPVLLRGGVAALLDTAPDLMLGVDPAAPRADVETELLSGDLLLIFSDGLVEVRGASLDEGLERLRLQVQQASGAGPDRLAEELLAAVSATATDDIALLVVQVVDGRRSSAP
ncbi:MAG: hypothetical protein NVS3B26_14080 [Mycobacteriales bacterium]